MGHGSRRSGRRSGRVAKPVASRRNVVVLASLLGSLTLASVLLLVWAPDPLTPDAVRLLGVSEEQSLDLIYETENPIKPGRWQCIYVHHSKGQKGDALSLGRGIGGMPDHFLIGNGNGCEDGGVQVGQRWNLQQAAGATSGKQPLPQLAAIADGYISICLVGDLDTSPPTDKQLQRLQELVRSLQQKLRIPGAAVLAFDRPASTAGIGRRFPAVAFSEHLLP